MEAQHIVVRDPSAWQDEMSKFLTRGLSLDNITLTVTIQVYGLLRDDEEWTRVERDTPDDNPSDYDERYHIHVLDPLIQDWVSAIKPTFEVSDVPHDDRLSKVTFDLDITQPTDVDRIARCRLAQSEPRILTRLANLLRSTFRPHASSLEGIISGSRCWCALQAQQKCIAALPNGQSYPVRRESHVQEVLDSLRTHWLDESKEHFGGYQLEERKSIGQPTIHHLKGHIQSEGLRCLRLAKEHWDDPYWKEVGVDEGDQPPE